MAPEALKGKPSLKSDIWSAGIMMHFLLTGCHPFHGKDDAKLRKQIEKGIPDLVEDTFPSKASLKLVQIMLAYH